MIKHKLVLLSIFTIILTSLGAQNEVNKFDKNGERHGVWQKNYPKTKQLRYQGQFVHGKEIDTFKYYKLKRNKSVLSAIKIFNADNNTAEVTFLTSKGKLVSKGKMNGKKFIGKWVYFHNKTDGIMIEEYYNSEGKLKGERKVYFINGTLAETAEYKTGTLNGLSKIYSESGKLLQESSYKDDKLDGKTTYYDINGTTQAEGSFKANLKVGIWMYYTNGNLTRKVDHDKNEVLYKKQ